MEPTAIKTLDDLGPRICVLGPSNAGKSTLANAIAKARGSQAIHIDQLRFLPNTAWVMRPDDEFLALHDKAIKAETWVMDGNYKVCLSPRLERASSVILLQVSVLTGLYRYFRRTWFESNRVGALEGRGKDAVTWEMIHWLVFIAPKKAILYESKLEGLKIPVVRLSSQKEMDSFYARMGLIR